MNSVFELIESVKDYNVLFVGDTIIDEYHYVKPLGRSAKEYLIPTRFEHSEVFIGGVGAAAKHCESFCRNVDVLDTGPITRKVRFVDSVYQRKLFEVQYADGYVQNKSFSSNYDAVVVTDFGHGAIKSFVENEKRFLAVAAQTNSSNIGFNLITKYPRADYIVIDEPEARLAAADRDSPIEGVILKLAKGRCNKFVVTLGHNGAIGYDGEFHRCPVARANAVDTMGAGDAFFAVTAPMAKTGSMKDLLLIGNAAGALKCEIRGHREPVTKDRLIAFLKSSCS